MLKAIFYIEPIAFKDGIRYMLRDHHGTIYSHGKVVTPYHHVSDAFFYPAEYDAPELPFLGETPDAVRKFKPDSISAIPLNENEPIFTMRMEYKNANGLPEKIFLLEQPDFTDAENFSFLIVTDIEGDTHVINMDNVNYLRVSEYSLQQGCIPYEKRSLKFEWVNENAVWIPWDNSGDSSSELSVVEIAVITGTVTRRYRWNAVLQQYEEIVNAPERKTIME